MRKKKDRPSGRRRGWLWPFFFRLASLILAAAALWFLFAALARALGSAPFFTVRDIVIRGGTEAKADLAYLKGRNIFSLDIKSEARGLSRAYPDFKAVRIIRVFPDRLFVEFIKRRALAEVRLYRLFFVDADGVLFDMPDGGPGRQLPLIRGLETKIFGPKCGRQYSLPELKLAIEIVREAGRQRGLKGLPVLEVDVASASCASLTIGLPQGGRLEARVGQDEIRRKLALLATLFSQERHSLSGIKYIDLRFKEAVIGYNDAK